LAIGSASLTAGGRGWWAHIDFIRINIQPTFQKEEIEENPDVLDAGGFLAGTRVDARGRMTDVISRGR
jgi:hypothetical protein